MAQSPAACWTLTDGRAGNVRQVRALAIAMGFADAREVALQPRAPWRWAAPRVVPGSAHAFAGFAELIQTPPLLAIGCGRQAALATRQLRARGARVVQILDPRASTASWDVVIAPEHDALAGDNVITLVGSLHPVDDAWLAQARNDYSILAPLAAPRTTLLLGGPSEHIGAYDTAALARDLQRLASRVRAEGGSLLATTSRRTSADWAQALRTQCGDVPGLRWFAPATASGDDSDNPYPGMLAWADRIVCTGDSVNMLSEACATRVPVFVLGGDAVRGKLQRLHEALHRLGRVRAFDDALASFEVEPLRETARVAAEARARLGL
ncbi:putative nucleoside-diphosphate-sugar epimerase [Lysobacter dokdonensis DS-58]|uniref:Putative nucleoside-diphosphate-sugar epimerase n=1 Tax=Lysobacter dokdonensis DS-58 TaxID=1300345 RepID=A0A0A2WES6_9GAMM|nr:mitochondrial fission ELM1 family protein [Lysobacter dokdonensis]KGQ18258.1 putative nucleoside-diphosphate-sugar epimerase [Lysobacter dokdonensis DS-58]